MRLGPRLVLLLLSCREPSTPTPSFNLHRGASPSHSHIRALSKPHCPGLCSRTLRQHPRQAGTGSPHRYHRRLLAVYDTCALPA